MKKSGVKKLALIGFGDSYGDAWSKVSADMAKAAGILAMFIAALAHVSPADAPWLKL